MHKTYITKHVIVLALYAAICNAEDYLTLLYHALVFVVFTSIKRALTSKESCVHIKNPTTEKLFLTLISKLFALTRIKMTTFLQAYIDHE